MRKRIYLALCVSIFLIFTSCKKSEQPSNIVDTRYLSDVTVKYETAKVICGEMKEINYIGYNELNVLSKDDIEFRFEYDVILKEIYVKRNQMIKKGELIAELDTEKIEGDIEFQEFRVKQEKVIYNKMKSSGNSEEELKIQELEVKILEKKLKKLIQDKEKFKIYAPTDGYIIRGNLIKGRKVEAGEILFVMTDVSKFLIKTGKNIDMSRFGNVKIGDKIKFVYEKQSFTGEVCFISIDENNLGEIYFQADEYISFGQKKLCDVQLLPEFYPILLKDVLTVPRIAVNKNGKKYVETIKDGIRRRRYIKCGAIGYNEENEIIVQVLSGLKEGETVILETKIE